MPTAVLAGAKGKATVKITNMGQLPVAGPVATTLYVSDDPTFSLNDVAVGSPVTKTLKLKTNKSKSIRFAFNYPGTLGGGNYYVLARVDSGNAVAETKERNNVSATAAAISIAPAFVDPQPTSVAVPKGKLTPGGKASALVTLKNNGNVPLSQSVTIALTATGPGGDTQVATVTKTLRIKQGGSKGVKVPFQFANTLAAGQYTLTATVSTSGTFNDNNPDNNTAISPAFAIA
jgi:subtilase family serine protease